MINKMTLEPHGNNIELIFFLIVVKAQGKNVSGKVTKVRHSSGLIHKSV